MFLASENVPVRSEWCELDGLELTRLWRETDLEINYEVIASTSQYQVGMKQTELARSLKMTT